MQFITYSGKRVNFEAIVEQFRAALSDRFVSAALEDDRLTVELTDDANLQNTRAVYDAHDASRLSERQQVMAVRQAQLEILRANVADRTLSEGEINALDQPFKLFAQKLQWLELELRAVRGEL
jgi:hypothetical protein